MACRLHSNGKISYKCGRGNGWGKSPGGWAMRRWTAVGRPRCGRTRGFVAVLSSEKHRQHRDRMLQQRLRLVMSERRLVAKVVGLPCCTSNPALSSRYGNPLVEAAQVNEKEAIRFREELRLFWGRDKWGKMKRNEQNEAVGRLVRGARWTQSVAAGDHPTGGHQLVYRTNDYLRKCPWRSVQSHCVYANGCRPFRRNLGVAVRETARDQHTQHKRVENSKLKKKKKTEARRKPEFGAATRHLATQLS